MRTVGQSVYINIGIGYDDAFRGGTIIVSMDEGDRFAVALDDGRVFVRDSYAVYTERPYLR